MSSVDTELKIIEERLSELEQEKRSLLKRKQQLLAREGVSNQIADAAKTPASTQEKLALFGSLFACLFQRHLHSPKVRPVITSPADCIYP